MEKLLYLLVFLYLSIVITGCKDPQIINGIPKIQEAKTFNVNENNENLIILPKGWNSYRSSIVDLIGIYIVLKPDKASPTGYSINVLGNALTEEGSKNIKSNIKDDLLYNSRVNGNFAGKLSFAIGNVSFNNESIYDLTLKDSAVATISPDTKYIDQNKISAIIRRLPNEYKDIMFVTSVSHRILSYKEYKKITGDADAAYSLIKAQGSYYSGNELNSISHLLFVIGISDASLFGQRNEVTELYTKFPLQSAKTLDTAKLTRLIGIAKVESLIGKSNPNDFLKYRLTQIKRGKLSSNSVKLWGKSLEYQKK